ncbi:MAG: cysteine desulfurase NifS [Desulfotomaculaceae bacterium]|nr:cysteine desulfurase NifS [Desulfotomaculaceae bacterium]
MRRIYFDHSATTPVHPLVAREMDHFLTGDNFGNPSSMHYFGRIALNALDEAREKVARAIGASTGEIIFTSSGTESDNMAIHGAAYTNRRRGNHIITSAVEHHAVLHTVRALESHGFDVTILPVDRYGMVDINDVEAAITDKTILISVMHANNEVGTIMPIAEIGRLAQERRITFHVDAVQSFGKIPVNVDDLGVNLLSLAGHKFYGPKGVGMLYVRKGTPWKQTMLYGGAQEHMRRAGTENIPAIVGFGKAVELAVEKIDEESKRLITLRDRMIKEVLDRFPHVELTGHPNLRLPNHVSFVFRYIEGESMLLSLDMRGIAVSSGSACTSGSLEPSHVLLSMGYPHEVAHGSLRLTLGKDNTEEDVEYFLDVMEPIVTRLRAMSPLMRNSDANIPAE